MSHRAAQGFRAALALAMVAASAAGCHEERTTGAMECLTWEDDIQPLFAERCASCHGETAPDGDYSVTDYLSVLGPGSDQTADAIAGDPSSLLVTVLDPATADASHQPVSDLYDLVRHWVVDCNLGYIQSSVHGSGLMNPADTEQFHGAAVKAENWDLRVCQNCHGQDYAGGTVGVSCLDCHQDTPEDCSTCHTLDPTSGSHPAHLGHGPQEKKFDCTECHPKVETYWTPGHVFNGDCTDPNADCTPDSPPAEVVFGDLANLDPLEERTAPASEDPVSHRCRNVYCHGGAFADGHATNTRPVWGGEQDQAACGTCHGLGPQGHTATQCSACHPDASDAPDPEITDPSLHIDGLVQAPSGMGCDACHGTGPTGAPPPDLSGNTATSALGVGAHQAHLQASEFRGPIPCGDCHLVPAGVGAPGHLGEDHIAEVFPDVEGFVSRAEAQGSTPVWNRDTATCSGVYCHGGSPMEAGDTAPDIIRNPVWTDVGNDQVVCGSCHGLPPTTGFHNPTIQLTDCHNCHPDTVDASGAIIITGEPGAERSKHINGLVDTF